jgi:hypothetical protein
MERRAFPERDLNFTRPEGVVSLAARDAFSTAGSHAIEE